MFVAKRYTSRIFAVPCPTLHPQVKHLISLWTQFPLPPQGDRRLKAVGQASKQEEVDEHKRGLTDCLSFSPPAFSFFQEVRSSAETFQEAETNLKILVMKKKNLVINKDIINKLNQAS